MNPMLQMDLFISFSRVLFEVNFPNCQLLKKFEFSIAKEFLEWILFSFLRVSSVFRLYKVR